MELTIKDKLQNFTFGIKFVRELDKKFFIEKDGVKFGAGLSTKLVELYSGSVVALADILHCATTTESKRASLADIEEYVESCDDVEKLIEDVLGEIESNNAGKLTAKGIKEAMKKA